MLEPGMGLPGLQPRVSPRAELPDPGVLKLRVMVRRRVLLSSVMSESASGMRTQAERPCNCLLRTANPLVSILYQSFNADADQ